MKKIFYLSLAAMVLCVTATAQDLKPAKDKQSKKYGYQDKAKNWVIAPAYDDAKKFDDGCARVKEDGSWLPEHTEVPCCSKHPSRFPVQSRH